MGLLIIGMSSAFVFVSIGLFSLLSRLFTNKRIKNAVILLGILMAISPILFLYIRDSIIAEQFSGYCEKSEGTVVVADIGDKFVEFSKGTGEDSRLWMTLFSYPERSLIINVKKSNFVKKPGRYLFSAMPTNSPECLAYDNFIEHLPAKVKEHVKNTYSVFSGTCIGISEYQPTENIMHLEYQTEYFPISKNPFYIFKEEKVSLIDKSSEQEFVFSVSFQK